MRIKNIRLRNFRGALDFNMELEPGLTLLAGKNGAGKSTVMDGIAILLSWAVARLRSPNSGGRRIPEIDIHNQKNTAILDISCESDAPEPRSISWSLLHTRKGRNPSINNKKNWSIMVSLKEVNEWANEARERIGQADEKLNLPLFVYYPIYRAAIDIPLRIRRKHQFGLLDAFEGAFVSGANFRSFFEWYRDREDIENEHLRDTGVRNEDKQLQAVRKAIMAFLPEFSNIAVRRNPLRMEVEKDGAKFRIEQLSFGEKCLFSLIGDLSRRLAIANPVADDPLQGEGIVLIDEIDLHLHPAWQRMVIPGLLDTFPNCQFIVSTHSPQVLGEIEAKSCRLLSLDPTHGLSAYTPDQALGFDSTEVLETLMDAEGRNHKITEKLGEIFQRIDEEKFIEAKKMINELREELNGSIPDLIHAESLITMLGPGDDE